MNSCITFDWGNRVEIENELGIKLDSLEFTVCGVKSLIIPEEYENGHILVSQSCKKLADKLY